MAGNSIGLAFAVKKKAAHLAEKAHTKKIWSTSLIVLIGSFLALMVLPFQHSHSEDENEHKGAFGDKPSAADDLGRRGAKKNVNEINEACIQKDLMGRCLDGWTFDEQTICRIRILNARYRNNAAILNVSVKAVKHVGQRSGWTGKQGELQLVYEYQGHKRQWQLTDIEAPALCKLSSDDVDTVRKTHGLPLLIAVDEGDLETVKARVKKGANLYQRARKGETALMIAARRGHVDVAKYLVKKGLPVDASTPDGLTALMFAAIYRQPQMARFLLENGADVNARGALDYTALLVALGRRPDKQTISDKNLVPTLSTLLDHGAHVNVRDGGGLTPLWLALKTGNEAVVQLILDHGADVNMASGASGFTPLMEAVTMGQPSIVKMLLEKGANVYTEKNGVTALEMAKRSSLPWHKKRDVIRMLDRARSNR